MLLAWQSIEDIVGGILEAIPLSSQKAKDQFCYYPFIQMVLDPEGNIQPCCWLPDFHIGNIKKNSLMEIWNGKQIQDLRSEFLQGDPKVCRSKMNQISCHKASFHEYTKNIPTNAKQQITPKRLDLRLNGKCNLQCIMCNVWEMPNGIYTDSNFWGPAKKKFFANLQELIVLGGEPFVQKDTFRLIDEVSEVNKDCLWGFITNGQYDFNQKIVSSLSKIKIRYIQVSLDSLSPSKYKVIRRGGRLERSLDTLQKIISLSESRKEDKGDFVVSIAMCIQKQNFDEVEAFFQFASHLNLQLGIQFVSHPESESLLGLADSERLKILKNLEKIQKKYHATQLSSAIVPLRESLM